MLRKCKKKEYQVKYEITRPGIEVHNFLEDAHYVTDKKHNVILTGVLGEQWVISEEKLNAAYKRDRKGVIKGIATSRVNDTPYFFEVAEAPCVIKTKTGVTIKAAAGDILICSNFNGTPNTDDKWVVNNTVRKNGKTVWDNTYEIVEEEDTDGSKN